MLQFTVRTIKLRYYPSREQYPLSGIHSLAFHFSLSFQYGKHLGVAVMYCKLPA